MDEHGEGDEGDGGQRERVPDGDQRSATGGKFAEHVGGGLSEDVGFPYTAAVAAEMAVYGTDEHYALVLEHLLRGLASAAGS